MKRKHPLYYKSLSLRWSEKGQAGSHGKDASSLDLRSERISHRRHVAVPRLKKTFGSPNCDSEIADIQIWHCVSIYGTAFPYKECRMPTSW